MNKYVKISAFVAAFMGMLATGPALAAVTGTDEYADAKALISENAACDKLNESQLERMGDYYMEQMMPGTAHRNMDQILGGEGSESLKQMHILMARRWYCGDAIGMGMMGMMMGSAYAPGGYGMMGRNFGGGMMGNWQYAPGYDRGYGMMGYYNNASLISGNWASGLLLVLSIVFVAAGIAALIKYLLKR